MPQKYNGLLDQDIWPAAKSASWTSSLRPRARSLARDALRAFIPSISHDPSKRLRPTAYLDGLRGFAAFIVYWHHHQLWPHSMTEQNILLESAFGYKQQYFFAAFPGVRTLFSGGHLAVAVFFVISGYVLSTKPLSLIHTGELSKLGDSLASAFFRRWLRLYIPVIVTTFFFMTSWHALGIWVQTPKKQSNYRDELWSWYCELKNFSFVFRNSGDSWFTYNFHAWSIPVEFKGSIVVYTSLAAFSRCKRNSRLMLEVALVVYFMYITDAAHFAMFMAGLLLCDLDLLAKTKDLPKIFTVFEPFKELIFFQLLLFGIYLGGVPVHDLAFPDVKLLRESPGWYLLSYLKPQAVFDYKWFYLFWAAIFIVSAIPRLPFVKAFFETSFCQYLGKISFALYLVHGPVIWILGDRVYAAVGWVRDSQIENIPLWVNRFPISNAGPLGLELNLWVPQIILLPVTICIAEFVTKSVDEPSVRFTNWLYKKSLPTNLK